MPDWLMEPHWSLGLLYILAGLYGLAMGGDLLVAGAVGVARRLGLTPAVIGATVVAAGTSAPELVVSLSAASDSLRLANGGPVDPEGPVAIAIGNIIGSNIANVGLILGLTLLLHRAVVPRTTIRLDLPMLVLASFGCLASIMPIAQAEPVVVRGEGLVLLGGLVAYLILAMRSGADPAMPDEPPMKGAWWRVAAGLCLLLIGGRICLSGAVSIATAIGMSQRVIGVTVVAVGTSLPELFASIQAARRGHTDVALTNVVGSNIFNILCILGVTSVLVPLPVNRGTLQTDIWWMLGFLVILLPGMLWRRELGRGHGVLLLAGYTTYTVLVLSGIGG